MAGPDHHVVIVGGGFGGLTVAQALKRAPVQITLLDRRNFHLFQPLLYQVATGGLSPANIASPLRTVLARQKNARVLMGEVVGLDPAARKVLLTNGEQPYDTLVVATGARHQYFGHDEWEPSAPGLKTIEDATAIRRRILSAFEEAEREPDPARRAALLTFVVVGGGPTGVELAGTIGELAHRSLRGAFRVIDPRQAHILLVEGLDRVLTTFPPKLSAKAERSLNQLGVTVRLQARVTDVRPGAVTLQTGDHAETVAAHTVLWAAGVQASPLGKALAAATGVSLDRADRVMVQPDLTLPGHPEIFVIGDLANFSHQGGKPLPGVAPVAMQEGKYVARLIDARVRGRPAPPPFRYRDRGNLATIGRSHAVADLHWLWLWGWPAWVMWLAIHLFFIIIHGNRLLIMMQWAWNYWTFNRSALLITGDETGEQRQPKA